MKDVLGAAAGGLPALLGVLLGVRVFNGGWPWLAACVVLILVGWAASAAGIAIMAKSPRTGRWLIEAWVLTAIGIVAIATSVILWIGLQPLPPALFGTISDADAAKAAQGAAAGALTAYVALLWTKDISDGKGYFWPSSRFKAGMLAAYGHMTRKPPDASPTSEAMFEDVVTGHGEIGWDFSARGVRAAMLAEFLATP